MEDDPRERGRLKKRGSSGLRREAERIQKACYQRPGLRVTAALTNERLLKELVQLRETADFSSSLNFVELRFGLP
jgi:hypothetical protein